MADISPDKVSPAARMAAERLRMATEAHMTPEQRYERLVKKLPGAAQLFMPGTMGEAGFTGAGALAATGAALAPETFGTSLVLGLPLAGAMIGGALEDPAHRLGGALYEGAKGVGQEALGKLGTKGFEWAGRFFDKQGILTRMAQRIGSALPTVFSEYGLSAPQTAKELEDQVSSGKIVRAAGKNLGDFREGLERRFGKYTAAVPSKLVNASAGVMPHYTPSIAASGQAFLMPDIGADGNIVMRRMGIADAIEHVRELQSGGLTTAGTVKQSMNAPQIANVASRARDALVAQLNTLEAGLGDRYRNLSTDYGTAMRVQKAFTDVFREDRQIDQPKLLSNVRKAESRINQLKEGKGTLLREAVSPEGTEAIPEQGPGIRAHVGESGIRSMLHPPIPYNPETRALLPLWSRLLSNPQLAPLMGALGLSAGEDVTGAK